MADLIGHLYIRFPVKPGMTVKFRFIELHHVLEILLAGHQLLGVRAHWQNLHAFGAGGFNYFQNEFPSNALSLLGLTDAGVGDDPHLLRRAEFTFADEFTAVVGGGAVQLFLKDD